MKVNLIVIPIFQRIFTFVSMQINILKYLYNEGINKWIVSPSFMGYFMT